MLKIEPLARISGAAFLSITPCLVILAICGSDSEIMNFQNQHP